MKLIGCNSVALICQLLLKVLHLPPNSCSRTLTCFINLKNLNMLHARSLCGTLGLCYLFPHLAKGLAVSAESQFWQQHDQTTGDQTAMRRAVWERAHSGFARDLPLLCLGALSNLSPCLSYTAGVPMPAEVPHGPSSAHLTLHLPCC